MPRRPGHRARLLHEHVVVIEADGARAHQLAGDRRGRRRPHDALELLQALPVAEVLEEAAPVVRPARDEHTLARLGEILLDRSLDAGELVSRERTADTDCAVPAERRDLVGCGEGDSVHPPSLDREMVDASGSSVSGRGLAVLGRAGTRARIRTREPVVSIIYSRAVSAPLDRSATWPYDAAGEPGRYAYARDDQPNAAAVESTLGRLEGGRSLLYPAGMGAVTGVVLTMLPPGGTIALAAGAYYGHRKLFDHLRPWGINAVEYDQTGPPPAEADLILVEAPSNPMLTMPDLEAATAHPAPVVCDATLSSPLRLRPLEHGCDVSLHSATKVLAGHDDLLAGVVSVADDGLFDSLHLTRRLTGLVASADTAWLLERGLQTLEVRIDRMEATARELADRLENHPAVTTVRYPGFAFLISFDVADAAAARRVEIATTTIENATSLGGVRTKLESRHRWEGERCPEGLLRLSVGLEGTEVLWADLERALATA